MIRTLHNPPLKGVARVAALTLVAGCASVRPNPPVACPIHIRFGGIEWSVSNSAERFPGAARGFTWNECNVRVESLDGHEVLSLVLRKDGSGWHGAQIESESTYQYGTFSATIESPLRRMLTESPSAVLGFFAYVGPAYSNEIDIELTRWGNRDIEPTHYTVWHNVLGGTPRPESSFASGTTGDFAGPTRHRFTWTDRAVTFGSWLADAAEPIARPFTVASNVPTKPMHIMLNLWVEAAARMGAATSYEVRITSVSHAAP